MTALPAVADPNVLVGYATGDDSGVYRLTDDLAVVLTLDVLTPIVDDARTFGQIAAANALSDVYAMGGTPRAALNFLAAPPDEDDAALARDILVGGAEKVAEAEAALIGGHTIDDTELKYGLCVMGTVHPDRILTNANAQPGDGLVLTKPIGTGIVSTAVKGGLASPEHAQAAAKSMLQLNAAASQAARETDAHACTDVTGFGLVGHLLEMLDASGVGAVVEAPRVPLLPGAADYCSLGLRTGAGARSREYYACRLDPADGVGDVLLDLLHDAQTSGGLLIASGEPEPLLARLRDEGLTAAALIGRIEAEPAGKLRFL
jgi:selenide,water dikinase